MDTSIRIINGFKVDLSNFYSEGFIIKCHCEYNHWIMFDSGKSSGELLCDHCGRKFQFSFDFQIEVKEVKEDKK
jgi:hypothetical protein